MANTGLDQPFRFMDLPAEIRERVYELLFFGNEEDHGPIQPAHELGPQPKTLSSAPSAKAESMAHTARRQIHVYDHTEAGEQRSLAAAPPPYQNRIYRTSRRFSLAIFRANHALQGESESVFYGSASFNFMGPGKGSLRSWEWLSQLPRRYRRLIRHVEHFCFDSTSASAGSKDLSYTLFDWTLFMKILGNECPALQCLRLWVHSDQQESEWLAGASETDPWIQAILQLKNLENLRYFDMPGIRPVDLQDAQFLPINGMGQAVNIPQHSLVLMGYLSWHSQIQSRLPWLNFGNILRPTRSEPSLTANILPWLRVRLLKTDCQTAPGVSHRDSNIPLAAPSMSILKFPPAIRALIYRYAILPANKRVHPYIKSWYDETTRAAVPLLLACRAVREEAEQMLYGHGIFTFIEETRINATGALRQFFKELPLRLRLKIRYVLVDAYCNWIIDPTKYLTEEMFLQRLTLLLSPMQVQSLHMRPIRRRNTLDYLLWSQVIGRIKNVQLKARGKDDVEISPKVRKWFEVERREEWLKIENRRQSLRSARRPQRKIMGK